MKKPLLFCLFLWIVLLALPWTRGQVLLDWRSATIEEFSGDNPVWAPLDPPYRPEMDMFALTSSLSGGMGMSPQVPIGETVVVNGLIVAPQFASVARGTNDKDVLLWCASSPNDEKTVARNMAVLERRFPNDALVLAWKCGAQVQDLSMTTRIPGPLTSGTGNWSVQLPKQSSSLYGMDLKAASTWDRILKDARRGQKLDPSNGFWWWFEVMVLLGARRDEEVWRVLKIGSTKTLFNDYGDNKINAIRRAHIKVQGAVPITYLMSSSGNSFPFYARWREATRQVCENIMGARMMGRHRIAVEGGRDLLLMGRLLRQSPDSISGLVGSAIENIVLRASLLPSASVLPRIPAGAPVSALAGHPSSLLRYANTLGRKDITRQIVTEWNALSKANKAQKARLAAMGATGKTYAEGVHDYTVSWAAGLQNANSLLVKTLPIPLIALAVLSLLSLFKKRREEAFTLPAWTRGLGWSAFALFVLIAAQTLLTHLVWATTFGSDYWGFKFILPRLTTLLPLWVFAFAACVCTVGALWMTVIAARRARGDESMLASLRGMLTSHDERTGTLNLSPLLQLIALVGSWGLFIAALGAWFYYPQQDALQNQSTETLHDQYPAVALALFCLLSIIPVPFFRARNWKLGAYFGGWAEVTRRFIVAHLVLVTALYVLMAIGGAYWSARFDAEWLKENTPAKNGTSL